MKYSAYVLLAGTLWGILSIFVSLLTARGFTAMACVELRACFTAVLMLVYLLVNDRSKLRIRWRDLPVFLGTGLLSIVFFNFCYFKAITLTGSAAVPALLLYTAPMFVMALSAVLFHEKITCSKCLACVVTFVGLGFVTGAFGGAGKLSGEVVLLGLGAGLGYALYSIFGKFVIGKYDSTTITFYTFVVAAIGSLPLSGPSDYLHLLPHAATLLPALGLALLSTVLPFLLYTKGLMGMEAGRAAILATIEPFVAALVGAAFFHETFTASKIFGMLLILGGILCLNMAPVLEQRVKKMRRSS